MAERFRMLLENKWELYDEKKMRKKKILIVGFLLLFIYALWFFLMYSIVHETIISGICASGFLLLFVLIIFFKVRQMDQKKDGWYFSALQDERLKREDVLELVRNFLESEGYAFKEEKTHRTMTLWITYFTLLSTDLKIRVWFSKIGGIPVVEMGIGPETPLNRELIEKLRDKISREFARRYGNNASAEMRKEAPKISSIPETKDHSVHTEKYEEPYKVK